MSIKVAQPNEEEENIDFDLSPLKELVLEGITRSEKWRRRQLNTMQNLIEENEGEIINALWKDLEKPSTEAYFEIIALKQELKLAKENLSLWMQPKKTEVPFTLKPGRATIIYEPLGCVLIIGPWNYPFSLTLQPLISALAAGNTAVLKPSEHAENTSNLIKNLIEKYYPENIVKVVEGDGTTAQNLTEKYFDHIFFTGGGEIGKKIMKVASNNLIPITLELGGKSPSIIIKGADLRITAKRLIWGKSINAGQTCIAPDHILVKEELYLDLIGFMKNFILEFYGDSPVNSKHLGKIINPNHFKRLENLITTAKLNNQIIFGGETDALKNKISPTLINIKDREDPLMKEEIFGPIMPILKFRDLEKTLFSLNKQPKPLAIYIFGGTTEEQNTIINSTSSGGVCVNDVVMQAGIPDLPFGGVGASGMGRYHGLSGFQTFSNQKSIFRKPFWLDINFRYPPYTLDVKWLKNLTR